jgi:hypothetical protein
MIVRNEKGEVVSDDAIARYILERHNLVLRALLKRLPGENASADAELLDLLTEAREAIPTLDEQRGHRAEDTDEAITRGIADAISDAG